MFHELRIYHCQPGKLKAELTRLEEAARIFFPRFGIKAIGYWSVMVGDNNHDLYYILEWQSLEERNEKWAAFASDPEWIRVRDLSEANGTLLTSITNLLLKPLDFTQGQP